MKDITKPHAAPDLIRGLEFGSADPGLFRLHHGVAARRRALCRINQQPAAAGRGASLEIATGSYGEIQHHAFVLVRGMADLFRRLGAGIADQGLEAGMERQADHGCEPGMAGCHGGYSVVTRDSRSRVRPGTARGGLGVGLMLGTVGVAM